MQRAALQKWMIQKTFFKRANVQKLADRIEHWIAYWFRHKLEQFSQPWGKSTFGVNVIDFCKKACTLYYINAIWSFSIKRTSLLRNTTITLAHGRFLPFSVSFSLATHLHSLDLWIKLTGVNAIKQYFGFVNNESGPVTPFSVYSVALQRVKFTNNLMNIFNIHALFFLV